MSNRERISHLKLATNLRRNGFTLKGLAYHTIFVHRTGERLTVTKSWGDLPVSKYLPRISEILGCSEDVALEVIFDGKILEREAEASLFLAAADAARSVDLSYEIKKVSRRVRALPDECELRSHGEHLLSEFNALQKSIKSFVDEANRLNEGEEG